MRRTGGYALAFVGILASSGSLAESRAALELVNQTSQNLHRVILTRQAAESAPEEFDISLAPGETATINVSTEGESCLVDMSLVFVDGSLESRNDVDLCQTDSLIIE
jgi:hypothetical protein